MKSKLFEDYRRYAMLDKGISSNKMDGFLKMNSPMGSLIEPTILEERTMNMTQLSVFSALFGDRILFLGTEIDSDVANIINSQLMYLNSIDRDNDIKLFINSPGGSVVDGLAIYDVMNYVHPDVSTYCMGSCASMGSILLTAGCKGKRYSLPHGSIMIHQVSGNNGRVNTADMEIALNEQKRLQSVLYGILAQQTGKSVGEISAAADRDRWFTPEEAIDFGLIDSTILKQE